MPRVQKIILHHLLTDGTWEQRLDLEILATKVAYNQLPVIAEKLGLDTRNDSNLWKDHALLTLNEAVIWSFNQDGVRIVDHHTASKRIYGLL